MDRKSASIVVIDDDAMVRRILATVLEDFDLNCFEDGASAIHFLSENPNTHIDLVISDYGMPVGDGVQTLQHIRQIRPNAKLMLISGTISENLEQICSIHQFDHFLVKPFSLQDLQESVEKLLISEPSVDDTKPIR